MIYFFHGTDIEKARAKAHDLILSLQKKKPDASLLKIDGQNFSPDLLREYTEGQGLFVSKNIVFLDRLCEKKDIKEVFVDSLKDIAQSENIFIVLEGKLDKVTMGKIEKKAEKSVAFEVAEKVSKKEELNAFEIANALGSRDKKKLWTTYRILIDSGKAPEELHGILFWKVKTMILGGVSYAWKPEELKNLLERLIVVYHEARRGSHELETGLETLLLTI